MKTINYEKTHGSFTINYVDDNELYYGTINEDENSLKSDLAKYIIDNEENTFFIYPTKSGSKQYYTEILLLKKEIEIVYEEVSESTYYKYNYNKNDEFKNIKFEKSLKPSEIYFQFYYKPAEYKTSGTISNKIINGLKKFPNPDNFNKEGYTEEFKFFKKVFIKNFLKKYNLLGYNIITCIPSHNKSDYNNNPVALMIQDITSNSSYLDGSQLLLRVNQIAPQKYQKERYEKTHLESIKLNGDVKGKKIILVDDITTSGSSLKACKKILIEAGAESVICFAFCKSS